MRRLLLLAFVALALAPGTWLRSDVSLKPPVFISFSEVEGPGALREDGWQREGIWEYRADHKWFGGYSAMLTMNGPQLRAFSDRGFRFVFVEPDRKQPERQPGQRHHPAHDTLRQLVEPERSQNLWDIEAATRDPATGTYWLAYENVHTIHRFTAASEPDGYRDLDSEVDWGFNSGAEAMVRLKDGRFVVLPEVDREGLIYAGDPVDGVDAQTFPFQMPDPELNPVDMKQLPDGRLLVLLRDLKWSWGANWPPFASVLAIGEPPRAGEMWSPRLALDLGELVPPENYEGLSVRTQEDGRIAVWLISDDNLAALQRTLVIKLSFDLSRLPAALGADQPKQKARETARTP